jgi:hypothetical protein
MLTKNIPLTKNNFMNEISLDFFERELLITMIELHKTGMQQVLSLGEDFNAILSFLGLPESEEETARAIIVEYTERFPALDRILRKLKSYE